MNLQTDARCIRYINAGGNPSQENIVLTRCKDYIDLLWHEQTEWFGHVTGSEILLKIF